MTSEGACEAIVCTPRLFEAVTRIRIRRPQVVDREGVSHGRCRARDERAVRAVGKAAVRAAAHPLVRVGGRRLACPGADAPEEDASGCEGATDRRLHEVSIEAAPSSWTAAPTSVGFAVAVAEPPLRSTPSPGRGAAARCRRRRACSWSSSPLGSTGSSEPSGRPPPAPHRTHWYAYVIEVPLHVPVEVMSVPAFDGRPGDERLGGTDRCRLSGHDRSDGRRSAPPSHRRWSPSRGRARSSRCHPRRPT